MGIFTSNKEINELYNIQNRINDYKQKTHNSVGALSDGYHTFDELYHHRAVLFASICALLPKEKSWKSLKHSDGTMFDDMFIVGIDTPFGQATYHYDIEPYFNGLFKNVTEIPNAPEWDEHTPEEAINRIEKYCVIIFENKN